MNLPDWHIHVSERQPGAWIDCTWDSGVEFVRLTHDKAVPATHAEGDALRVAGGRASGGGGNIGNLRDGIKKRYGYDAPPPVGNFNALWAALVPGTAAVVQGSMAAFNSKHRLSRFDPGFDGGHAVLVMRLDGNDRVWWCDPEAPAGSYKGEWVTKAELSAFVKAFAGQHIVAPILGVAAQEDPMSLKTYLPGYTADVKAGSNVRSAPRIASTKLHATTAIMPVAIIGTELGDVDPGNGSNIWYALWHEDRVEFTAKDNITNLKAPVAADDGYTKATQDAAVAAAVAKATADEKERIAKIVGESSADAIRSV